MNSQSGGQAGRELRNRCLYFQSGAHGALGIIAASKRRSEQRHRRVADVLVDRPTKAVDGSINERKETLQQGMHVFGIQHRREVGIADQIAKQHGNRTTVSLRIDIPLSFARPNPFADERVTAAAAIMLGRLVRKATVLAGYWQCRAAGGAEFASRSVLQFAFCAPHSVGLRCPR
jgi:hypothetical protein